MLSFHRTRINAKHIDGVIKLASFDIVKQFQNLFGKVNLFTASILHLIITPWSVTLAFKGIHNKLSGQDIASKRFLP